MKKLFLHAGLHKTGSTALQLTLNKNRERLKLQDVHYPLTGISKNHHGQQNIAWEFCRDRRFRNEYGNIRALLKEIILSNHSKIVLSSEDFESSLIHPHRWVNIVNYFSSNNIEITFVIYLRNQIDYLKSMYFELLKAGFGDEFKLFSRKIISNTKYNFKEWEFILDYQKIFHSLNTLKNVDVIYRDYDSIVDKNTVVDFFNVTEINYRELTFPDNVKEINKTLSINTLIKLFVRNRMSNDSSDFFKVVDEMCTFEEPILQVPIYTKEACLGLIRKNSFYKNTIDTTQSKISGNLNMEKIFSFETFNLILNLNKLHNNYSLKNELIKDWKAWVAIFEK